jgi:hypothetical protein
MDDTTVGAISWEQTGGTVDWGPTLGDEPVQILVVGSFDAQIASADVIDGLVVDHETAVRVLQSRVGGKNGVVRLDHRGRHLRGGIDAELEFALLAVVDR